MKEREMAPIFSEDTGQVNFQEILTKYLQYWYLFLIGGIMGLGTAYIYLLYTTPLYSISTTLLIKDNASGGPGLSEMAIFSDIDILSSTKSIDNEMVLLKSNSLMQRVLSELSLNTSYFVEGPVQKHEIYGKAVPIKVIVSKLYPLAFHKSITIHIKNNNSFTLEEEDLNQTTHKFGQQIIKPYGIFTVVAPQANISSEMPQSIEVKFNDIQSLADTYAGKLNISPVNKQASVLRMSITDPTPEKGVDIINKVVEVYNRDAVEDKNLIAAKTIDFIDERLKYLTTELSVVEKDVEQYKRQNQLADVSSQAQQYLVGANEYNKQAADIGIQKDVLESIEAYLKKQDSQYKLVPSSLSIQDPTLLGLINKFNELQIERERMLRTMQPNNPIIQNINEQLSNLQVNILENLRNIKNGLSITRKNLEIKSGQFGSRIKQVPVMERQLVEITRQQEIKHSIYLYLLQKREESALSLAATVSNTRVIDPATAYGPISPNKNNIYIYYFLLGLVLPVAGIYLRDLFNNKIQTLKEVEKGTLVPLLGEIVHNDTNETIVVIEKSRTPIAELFRLIRTNLDFMTIGKENRVILVTSSMSGEGKTFFSINLGASLAITGKKVIVLGFDLRIPKLLAELGLPNSLGITNFLVSDSSTVDDIIQPSKIVPSLFVMGSGPVPPNPAELMMSSRVKELFEELKERFDYIIIDSTPVGEVADAFTLKRYTDSTIYLVRSNYTFKSQLDIINDSYINNKLNHQMIVLNDVKNNNRGYGYGNYYGNYYKKAKSRMRSVPN